MLTTEIELLYLDVLPPKFLDAFRFLLDLEITIPEAVALTKTMDVINKEITHVKSVEYDLLKKYGVPYKTKTETGFQIEGTTPEKREEFDKKYNELRNQSFKIPLTNKIILTKDMGNIKTSYLYFLQKLVEVQ